MIILPDVYHNNSWPIVPTPLAVIHKLTQGAGFVDPLCASRMAGSTPFPGKRGFYHFSSGADPALQAAHFVSQLASVGYIGERDLLCLDFEHSTDGTADMTNDAAVDWIARVEEATGATVCVYGSDMLVAALQAGEFARQPLWHACYDPVEKPLPNGRTSVLWQYTGDDLNRITEANFGMWPDWN